MSTWTTRENPTRSRSCWRVLRELQSYLDGVLEDAAARRVARHLEGCRRCVREAQAYQAIKNSLGRRRSKPEAAQRLRAFGAALLDGPGESTPRESAPAELSPDELSPEESSSRTERSVRG